jgi:serine/threonine protein kinase
MDKYVLGDKIGDGVLGIVHKISYKDDKAGKAASTPLVIKQIECQDFNSAQNALNEYRVFHTLNSPFVCKLKDSFVTWNPKISSTFVCYIMDFFEKGDLATQLNKMRMTSQRVPIECIHVWLASMVESVAYLHKNNLIHRNLKPSSLYLKPLSNVSKLELTKLILGDFGVITVMKDAKTKTRIASGAFDYIAPEIIDSSASSFDAKSDIWTIGTCLLDICTTSLYDHKQFHLHLLNVRHDDELLSHMLERIYNVYESKALINALKALLTKNKDKRPSIKAVIHDDFVQQCLETIQSDLVRYVVRNKNE